MRDREQQAEQAFEAWMQVFFREQDLMQAITFLSEDATGRLSEQDVATTSLADTMAMQLIRQRMPDGVRLLECRAELLSAEMAYLTARIGITMDCGETPIRSEQPVLAAGLMRCTGDDWKLARLDLPLPPVQLHASESTTIPNRMSETLQGIADSIPGGVCRCRVDADFTLVFASDGFYKLYGYTPEQMRTELGNRLLAAIHFEDGTHIQSLIEQAQAKGQTHIEFEQRVRRRDGEIVWLLGRGMFRMDRNEPVFDCVLIDINRRKLAEQALLLNEQRLCIALEQTTHVVFDYLVQEETVLFPDSVARMYHLPEQAAPMPDCFIDAGHIHPDDQEAFRQLFGRIRSGQQKSSCVVRLGDENHEYHWSRISMNTVLSENGHPSRAVGVIANISAQKQTEQAFAREESYRRAMLSDSVAYCDINLTRNTLDRASGGWARFINPLGGSLYSDHLAKTVETLVHREDRDGYLRTFGRERLLQDYRDGVREVQMEHRRIVEGARAVWMSTTMHLVEDPAGHDIRAIAYLKDIDERKRAELELQYHSKRDSLTGLLNKRVSQQAIESILSERRGRLQHAFLIVDLDHFKSVNDHYGHQVGDEVLHQMGERLSHTFRASDVVGRMGGDEFLVLMRDIKDLARVAEKACQLCNPLQDPSGAQIPVSCSVGISIYPEDGLTFEELYRNADRALYDAKSQGRNCHAFYQLRLDDLMPSADRTAPLNLWHPCYFQALTEHASPVLADALESAIYISDPQTYEMLFINRCLAQQLGPDGEHYHGRKCYELLQGRTDPCPYCNNHQLTNHQPVLWERHDQLLGRRYLLQDQLVSWNGKAARMELILDITSWHAGMTLECSPQRVLLECALAMKAADTAEEAMQAVVHLAGEGFHADQVRYVRLYTDGRLPEAGISWSRPGTALRPGVWEGNALEEQEAFCLHLASQKKPVAIHDIHELFGAYPLCGLWLEQHGVQSMWAIPLTAQPTGYECLVIDNADRTLMQIPALDALGYLIGGILEKSRLRGNIQYLSTHDEMTCLCNRKQYLQQLDQKKNLESIGVLIANINGMKQINERAGYRDGDRIVCDTARILAEQFGADHAYRLSGDEFAVIIPNISGRAFMERVRESQSALMQLLGTGIAIGYTWADSTPDPYELMEHATEMMTIEKQHYYQEEQNVVTRSRPKVVQELLQLLRDGCFEMYLQPKVDIHTGEIVGAEALARLNHPEHGLLPPSRFIVDLEREHLIRFVDLYIFEQVCKLLSDWKRQKIKPVCISLNFSRITLLETHLSETLRDILKRFQVTSEHIEIEITETIGNMERETLAELSRNLRNAGFRVSLDDFGAKYSSISILTIMKFDILKLDRSLVMHLAENANSQTVVQYIVEMCRRMNIQTIAEGVETEEQRALLEQLGCDEAQGYYYGRPMPRHLFEELLHAAGAARRIMDPETIN